jgi:hypothetical protein
MAGQDQFMTAAMAGQDHDVPSCLPLMMSAGRDPDDPDAAERQALKKALQAELDRLVLVPFGVPLLHEIG